MSHTCVEFGKLERIEDLRSVRRNEAMNYSKSLTEEENQTLLGKAIGIKEFSLLETESQNGDFRVVLLCKDESTGERLIVENQLEGTNHNHLGKSIACAFEKETKTITWIDKHARGKRASAIKWLNEKTQVELFFSSLRWNFGK